MAIPGTTKKNLQALTQLEKERELKKLRGETEELIETLGQENEKKGAQAAIEYNKEVEKAEQEQKEIELQKLKLTSNNKQAYQRALIEIMYRFIVMESIPKKYRIYADSTDEGIVLGIEGTPYHRAFRVCGIPMYDANACKVLAVQLGNTVARMEGHFRESEGGIILANEEELKLALKSHGTNK